MARFGAQPSPETILDPALPSPPPSRDQVQALLDELEAHREHAHTLAVHDALYGLRVALDDGGGQPGVAAALSGLAQAAALEHPLRARLLALTGQRLTVQQRSLEAILADQPGVPLREDPLEALELHLRQRRELVVLLEQRQEELVRNLQRTSRLLDLTAGAAVVLFLFCGLGWAIAMDWLSVVDEPMIEDAQDEEEQEPPAGARGRNHRSESP